MKRRVLLILLFLTAGAVVNVAVAWGCVYRSFYVLPRSAFMTHEANPELMLLVYPNGPNRVDKFWGTRAVFTGYLHAHAKAEWYDREDNYEYHEVDGHVHLVGWPAYGLATTQTYLDDAYVDGPHLMWTDSEGYLGPFPYAPIWPGFAINTVFYAVVLWLVFAAPFALRRRRRIKRGLCPKCAYDLRGAPHEATACPECGARFPNARIC